MEENKNEEKIVKNSIFKEIENINYNDAINILIQASLEAQKSGILNLKSSIYLGAAIEKLTNKSLNES